jgi:hypothetical protein
MGGTEKSPVEAGTSLLIVSIVAGAERLYNDVIVLN